MGDFFLKKEVQSDNLCLLVRGLKAFLCNVRINYITVCYVSHLVFVFFLFPALSMNFILAFYFFLHCGCMNDTSLFYFFWRDAL